MNSDDRAHPEPGTPDGATSAPSGSGDTAYHTVALPVPDEPAPDTPVAVVVPSPVPDDDPDILEPTQIMPPVSMAERGRSEPAGSSAPLGGGPPPGGQPPGGHGYPAGDPQGNRPWSNPGPAGPGAWHSGAEQHRGDPYTTVGGPPYNMSGYITPPPPAGRRRLLLIGGITAGVVVLAVGGFVGVRTVTGNDPGNGGAVNTAGPASPGVPDSDIDNASTDGKKLTLDEAFPKTEITINGLKFTRVGHAVATHCQEAADGAFAKALRANGCDRVVGVTFVDAHKRYAVTAGVAVLPSKSAVAKVARTADHTKRSWFVGLPGKKGSSTGKIDDSGGYAASRDWGRYMTFSWATYSDGHAPGKHDDQLSGISAAFRDLAGQAIGKRASS